MSSIAPPSKYWILDRNKLKIFSKPNQWMSDKFTFRRPVPANFVCDSGYDMHKSRFRTYRMVLQVLHFPPEILGLKIFGIIWLDWLFIIYRVSTLSNHFRCYIKIDELTCYF